MADLKALFAQRDKRYSKETLKILQLLHVTLGCVTSYLSETNSLVEQGLISWEEASVIDDTVVLIGMVEFETGTVIKMGDLQIPIDENNVDDFQSVIHMSVPMHLVEEEDEQKILDYLYDFGEDKDSSEFTSMLVAPPETTLVDDFDLSELSEEQIQMLKLHTPKGGQ
jgi:hypothetical protein